MHACMLPKKSQCKCKQRITIEEGRGVNNCIQQSKTDIRVKQSQGLRTCKRHARDIRAMKEDEASHAKKEIGSALAHTCVC